MSDWQTTHDRARCAADATHQVQLIGLLRGEWDFVNAHGFRLPGFKPTHRVIPTHRYWNGSRLIENRIVESIA